MPDKADQADIIKANEDLTARVTQLTTDNAQLATTNNDLVAKLAARDAELVALRGTNETLSSKLATSQKELGEAKELIASQDEAKANLDELVAKRIVELGFTKPQQVADTGSSNDQSKPVNYTELAKAKLKEAGNKK